MKAQIKIEHSILNVTSDPMEVDLDLITRQIKELQSFNNIDALGQIPFPKWALIHIEKDNQIIFIPPVILKEAIITVIM